MNRQKEEHLKCLRPGCDRPAYCRGLCHSDYVTVARYVHKGISSWGELEKQGKVLPTYYQKMGGRVIDWLRSPAQKEEK